MSVRLISKEGDVFEVSKHVAQLSQLVSTMIDEDEEDDIQDIPLPNVRSAILSKVLQFLQYFLTEPMKDIPKPLPSSSLQEFVQEWYFGYIQEDLETVFELISAANYLDIRPLLDLTCATVAGMIKGKNPEQLRQHFHIVNDFTPAEEAQIREENKWCEVAC